MAGIYIAKKGAASRDDGISSKIVPFNVSSSLMSEALPPNAVNSSLEEKKPFSLLVITQSGVVVVIFSQRLFSGAL